MALMDTIVAGPVIGKKKPLIGGKRLPTDVADAMQDLWADGESVFSYNRKC